MSRCTRRQKFSTTLTYDSEEIVGFVRLVGDGVMFAYVRDNMALHEHWSRNGVGVMGASMEKAVPFWEDLYRAFQCKTTNK